MVYFYTTYHKGFSNTMPKSVENNKERKRAEAYLAKKEKRLERILDEPERRKRMLRWLLFLAEKQPRPEKVEAVVCMGMSYSKFPDRLLKRIYWSCFQVHQGKAEKIVFTGARYHADDDYNQAAIAKQIAIKVFNIPKEKILTAGGRHSQEALRRARDVLGPVQSLSFVSEDHHLFRAMPVIREEMKGIDVFSDPVGGIKMLEPDDVLAIEELAKSRVYKGGFYAVSFDSPEIQAHAREQAEGLTGYLKERIRSGEFGEYPPEQPFNQWYVELPPELQFLGPDFQFPPEAYDFRNPILPPDEYAPYMRK
jgi:hypothetical protein